jgi:hypothetical protein
VESIKTCVAATRTGAAFLGVRSAWISISGVGANYVRTPNRVPAAWTDARYAALRPVPAMPTPLAPTLLAAVPAAKQRTVIETRKQTVHKTHMGAGNGATGPHPEREPAY